MSIVFVPNFVNIWDKIISFYPQPLY